MAKPVSRRVPACIVAVLVPACLVVAQGDAYRIEIVVDPPVVAPGEEATVTLLGHFRSPESCALASTFTDLLASRYGQAFQGVAPMRPFGGSGGTPDPSGVRSIGVQQLTGLAGEPGDTRNPIPFWQGRFVAPDVAGTERVLLATRTWHYTLNTQCCGHCFSPLSGLGELIEGEAWITISACRPDIDGDGDLTIFDFLAFQNAFDAMDPIADFDGDGGFTFLDFLAFQNAFDAGCA